MKAAATKSEVVRDSIREVMGMAVKKEDKQGVQMTPLIAVIVAICSLASSVIGGYIGSATTSAQWKGEMQTRLDYLERQRSEDKKEVKETFDRIRDQNEITGKDLSAIRALLQQNSERRR